MKKVVISNVVLAIAFALVGYWYYSLNSGIGPQNAGVAAEKYISENLVQPGTDVKVKGVSEENGMYKVDVTVGKQEVVTYMTKNGKVFFPQGMNMQQKEADSKKTEAAVAKDVPKSDKPAVELFVMSYCPYGTQIEKGILPVLDALGGKVDFQLKFVDYAMHQKKELDENLTQYCIQKDQNDKLKNYLGCFLKSGQSVDCLKTANVDTAVLATCVKTTDEQFGVSQKFNDKNSWSSDYPPFDVNKDDNTKYGVQGSPALVVNGVETQANRDPASLLKTICSAFNNQPDECKKQLSSDQPAPGFGDGKAPAGNTGGAECGN